ncbi:MAG: hypothetical protein ACFCUU_06995 [Cyclobacteriaceae bacterium]
MTHREVLNPGQNTTLAFLDEIASEPVVSRQAIEITVFEDGSADYLFTERSPKLFSLPPSSEGVPPDDTTPIVKTKITKGMAYFYDAQDNLMNQHYMGEDYGMRDLMLQLTGQYNWEAEAKAQGATVEHLSETTLLIRKPVPVNENVSEGPALRGTGGRYTQEVVVPDLNILLGSSLHEANGDLVSRVTHKYDYRQEKNEWIPKQIHYEEYATDEVTGSSYISRTTYYYENYSLQIH